MTNGRRAVGSDADRRARGRWRSAFSRSWGPPAPAAQATLRIENHTDPAGDPTVMTYNITRADQTWTSGDFNLDVIAWYRQLRPAGGTVRRPVPYVVQAKLPHRLAGRRHRVPRLGSPGRVQRRRGQRPRDDEPRERRRADLRLHQPPHLRVGLDGLERERDHAVAAACAARRRSRSRTARAAARHHRPAALRDRDGARRPALDDHGPAPLEGPCRRQRAASCTRPARTRSR